ncbi:hypothetical protein BDF20DRAFT_153933 [Mycotypha africana]|uniref:uncharacterized protein n=1 Tax=Mycotypha africana TaxID=64632 RepID=UPI002300CB63|nr:uncharacterized protein BDF20DRAFT_153933 [Mycotypha africana]KAI8969267.1 hypothetical protein BDF20DRAFT_153933 [Mycotypha africana]
MMNHQTGYNQQPPCYYHKQEPLLLDPSLRTVYLGNIPNDISVSTILDSVKAGPIQSIRPLPERNGLFITFLDAITAHYFFQRASDPKSRLTVEGNELKIGWGKPSLLPTALHAAIQNGATRNVYLGLLDDITEEELREDLSRFGHIEHVKIIPEKHIAFVHFLCVSNAVKCVNTLQLESKWKAKRINYGRDRCAPARSIRYPHYQPQHSQQQHLYMLPNTAIYQPAPSSTNFSSHHHYNNVQYAPFDTTTAAAMMSPSSRLPPYLYHQQPQHFVTEEVANRTIYLGNLHPDTTAEDICNSVRGGILSQLRFMPEKHIAFVTFLDSNAALSFMHQVNQHAIIIKNRRLKVGWGKPSALPSDVFRAVQQGATRNVYIGNIDFANILDENSFEERLRDDFSQFGDIELINTLKEKNCAFVNFMSISSAMNAIEGIRNKEEYEKFRISYGKDRCGNPPKIYKARARLADDLVDNTLSSNRSNITTAAADDQQQQQPFTTSTTINDTIHTTSNMITSNKDTDTTNNV